MFGIGRTTVTPKQPPNNMEEKDSAIKKFLWNISGFKKEVIRTCKVDSYHAQIIGTLLLIVGIYATLAWSFFFQTVTANPVMPFVAGLFMGFFILSFDRALIASMSAGKIKIPSIIFRLLLATVLGIFLAQPMILKFYEKDISREAQILVDKKNQERKKELEVQYKSDLDGLNKQKADLETGLNTEAQLLNRAEQDFKSEMDGSGGTGKWGYNTVSIQKEKILNKHREDYGKMSDSLRPRIDTIQSQINKLNDKIGKDFEAFKQGNTMFGTLIQVEALQSLLAKDKTGSLRMRYYLLAFILALIELSALIAKMLFSMKSYRAKVSFITEEEVGTSENDKEILLGKLEEYKNLTKEHESELIRKFFTDTKNVNNAKLDKLIAEWNDNPDGTYKEFWELFKKKFIINDNKK